MRLNFKAGTVAGGLGLIGGGVQLVNPSAEWAQALGWLLIVSGFLTFALDVHVEGNRIAVGAGETTWRDHLGNGLDRLRANWLSLTLVVGAVVVLAFAIGRVDGPTTSAQHPLPVPPAPVPASRRVQRRRQHAWNPPRRPLLQGLTRPRPGPQSSCSGGLQMRQGCRRRPARQTPGPSPLAK